MLKTRMTWHKKEAPKGVRRMQLAVVGVLLAGFALFAVYLLGLPYGIVLERSETREERDPVAIPHDEWSSRARVEWGN